MKKTPKKLLFFFILIAVAFVSCKIVFPSGSWRYKVTVEIETPEGIKSGSAVREVRAHTQSGIPNPDVARIRYRMSGEAVTVDLGERGVLFYLYDWDSNEEIENAFPFKTLDNAERIKYYSSLKIGTHADVTQNYQEIVTFKDLSDPKSVTLVLGGRHNKETQKFDPVDEFEELFGAGVKLKQVTIEITNKPVTWEIEKYLPWLLDLKKNKARLNGSKSIAISTNELADNLASGSFTTK